MADTITPAERAAIDAAVAAGRITRLPTGASAEPGWVWCDKARILVQKHTAHLSPGARREEALAAQKRAIADRMQRSRGATPATVARRAQVAQMFRAGATGQQMAEALNVTLSTIYTDLCKLRLSIKSRDARRPAMDGGRP